MAAKNESNLSTSAKELEEYFERMNQRTAPGWRPDPGTTERATVVGLAMREGAYGKTPEERIYPVITYKRADGSMFAVHAFHHVLRERLAELKTDIGTEQYITYVGPKMGINEETKQSEIKYHIYDAENVGDVSNDTTVGKQEGFAF